MPHAEPIDPVRLMARMTGGEIAFVTRRIAGETLLVPVAGRVGDLDSIYTLNEVASRIWELLGDPISIDGIVAVIQQEYQVDRLELAADVGELVRALESSGLIQQVAQPRV
jgi:hypothetical protein